MTKTDLAWIAGFFDGEGCVYINKQKNRNTPTGLAHTLCIAVAQKELTPLTRLQEYFGGSIYTDKRVNAFVWRLSTLKSLEFLEKIKPFSICKKKEIEVALQYNEVKGTKGKPISVDTYEKREFIYNKLRELKREKYGRS